jgi:hypothetical protein
MVLYTAEKAKLVAYFQGLHLLVDPNFGMGYANFARLTQELLQLLYDDGACQSIGPKPPTPEKIVALGGYAWTNRKALGKEVRGIQEITIPGAYPTTAMVLADKQMLGEMTNPHLMDLFRVVATLYPTLAQDTITKEGRIYWKYYLNEFYGQVRSGKSGYQIHGIEMVPKVLTDFWQAFAQEFEDLVLHIDTDCCFLKKLTPEQMEQVKWRFHFAGYHRLHTENWDGGMFFSSISYHVWNGDWKDHKFMRVARYRG